MMEKWNFACLVGRQGRKKLQEIPLFQPSITKLNIYIAQQMNVLSYFLAVV